MLKKWATVGLIVATLAMSACNTVAGLGRDVASVGKTVEDVAD